MDTHDNDLPKPDPEDEALRAQFLEEMRRRREEQEKREAEERRYADLEKKKPLYMHRRGSSGVGGIKGILARFGIEDEKSSNMVMIAIIVFALGATLWLLHGAFSGPSAPSMTPGLSTSTSTTPAP